jgi:redox-regulated HSP33 family molecular chaperone
MYRHAVLLVSTLALTASITVAAVDPTYRGYVKTVSIRNEKEGKATIKRMKIRTQQYNKTYSSTVKIHVEVTDAAGKKYYGETEAHQTRMRVDNWSQAEWLADIRTGALTKPEVTGYVVQHIATEKDDILDEKTDGVKSLDELKSRNGTSEKLEIKVVSYELLGL